MYQIAPLSVTDQRSLYLPTITRDGAPIGYYVAIDPQWKVSVLGNDNWAVIGLARDSATHVPTAMTLTSIEHEILESFTEQVRLETSQVEKHMPPNGYMSLGADEFTTFCEWLHTLGLSLIASKQDGSQYFHRQDHNDLISLGVRTRPWRSPLTSRTRWYRYREASLYDANLDICLVEMSDWSSRNPKTSTVFIRIIHYTRQQLNDPSFDPLQAEDLGYLRFTPASFAAFVSVLDTHRFETL